MTNIFEYNPEIDLTKHIFWQYNNAPAINSLINSKQNWYEKNQVGYWQDWVKNVLNITSANDHGLSIWGILLGIPRTYLVNGENMSLSREQYKTVILARLRMLKMRATIPEINKLLNFIFGKYGKAYVIDNLNMSLTYVFNFQLTDLQLAVIRDAGILPKPAGVEAQIISLTYDTFGFEGSDGLPFDQAPFAQYIDL